jgi:pyrroloquinoline quinone (PQQ) biosynthesis protein C
VSAHVIGAVTQRHLSATDGPDVERVVHDPLTDEDLHLALHVLYALHYRGFDGVPDDREWDPDLLARRQQLERVFERGLRDATAEAVDAAVAAESDVVAGIRALIEADDGPDVARFVQREATVEQVRDLLVQRSIYTLKESDPTSFVLPRVDGPVKVALAELQYDEYGSGRPDRLHAHLFARAMEAAGLDPTYGHYIDEATGTTLAVDNAMSMLGLHRRLRAASLGHLATYEATSTMPCRRMAQGIERLGFDEAVWDYFDEHVEADAVHEEVALADIVGRLVAEEPEHHREALFGAAVCLHLDAVAGRETLARWAQMPDRINERLEVPA